MTIERLEPGLRVLVAPNPSPMTLTGTNTYLLGEGDLTLIDPGPADKAHYAAILSALARGERIAQIVVTHAHSDHSPLARPLAEATGAPVLAFGPPEAGRSAVMADLVARGLTGGGEGVDRGFAPDSLLRDGETFETSAGALQALHTPGHFCNHLSLRWGDAVFTGDHIMGWASTLISPPDGDLGDYFRSLDKVEAVGARVFYSGHGQPVPDTAPRIAELRAHRQSRSAQILAALAAGPATARDLTRAIYTDTPVALWPAAERNVFAHLIELTQQSLAQPDQKLSTEARFERI